MGRILTKLIQLNWKRFGAVLGVLTLIIGLYAPVIPVGFWVLPPTGSMEPALSGCDILFYGPGEPEEDAVMMFWRDDHSLIVHRVIDEGEEPGTYLFKGDNLDEPDGEIPVEDIQAKVYGSISTSVPDRACVSVFEPTYNMYYMLLGSDTRFHQAEY